MREQYSLRQFVLESAFLTVLGVAMTLLFSHILYPLWGWPSDGPTPGRSIVLALVIVALARFHPRGIAGLGFKWGRRIWLIPVFAAVIIAAKLFVITPLADVIAGAFDTPDADLGPLTEIHGNPSLFALWLLITWTAAAFGEEIIFRGYILNRIAEILGREWFAWAAAIVIQASLFALGHYYQGVGGMLRIGVGAIFSGVFFVLFRRSLWPLIIAHGVWDTLGLTLLYLTGTTSTD